MSMKTAFCGLVVSLVLLTPAGVNAAAPRQAVLGDQGELFVALADTYGKLFPTGTALRADRPVLALEVTNSAGERQRYLVPGTGRPEVDGSAVLVFERTSRSVYVIWESRRAPESSALHLASWSGGRWGTPIEISGDVAPLKGVPQVLISRDTYSAPAADGVLTRFDRTLLHVVWWEQADGGERVFYAPIVIESGRYLGWNPVFSLTDLDHGAVQEDAPALPETLARSPRLAQGRDLSSVVIGFANPRSGKLLGVEARAVPGEIGYLADFFRKQLIDIGARDEGRIKAAIDGFRKQIIDIGHRLNPGVTRFFADETVKALQLQLTVTPATVPVEQLADAMRETVIRIGTSTSSHASSEGANDESRTLEISRRGEDITATTVTHLVEVRRVSEQRAPEGVGNGPAQIFLSEDAQKVLVSWKDGSAITYSESGAETGTAAPTGSWTAPQRLTLSETLDEAAAEAILESRVRQ